MDWGAKVIRLEDLSRPEAQKALFADLELASADAHFPRLNRSYHSPSTRFRTPGWPDAFPPWTQWTEQQQELFEDSCGEVMDDFYPGWRSGLSASARVAAYQAE